jgi:hypothetical protein
MRNTKQPLLRAFRELRRDLEEQIAYQAALELALEERLGRPPRNGDIYFEPDELRAQEIVAMYPKPEAE